MMPRYGTIRVGVLGLITTVSVFGSLRAEEPASTAPTTQDVEVLLKDTEYQKKMIDVMVGEVVFHQDGVLVSVERERGKPLKRVTFWADGGKAHFTYKVTGPAGPTASFTSGMGKGMVVWIDLNEDGWWDIRGDEKVREEEVSHGRPYRSEIRVGRDEWLIRRGTNENGYATTDRGVFRFDPVAGEWVPVIKQATAPATQPVR